jgi:hypothetical protein
LPSHKLAVKVWREFAHGVPDGEERQIFDLEVGGSIPPVSTLPEYLIVDDLFDRYKIIVEPLGQVTSVYCEECETWVDHYDGEHLSTHSESELLEEIVSSHEDDFSPRVEF